MAQNKYTDTDLLNGLKNNNSNVLDAFYKLYFGLITKYIIKNSGTKDHAYDIFQEVMVILFENTQKESFTLSCQLQTYIYSIARNLWLKHLKKKKIILKQEQYEKDIIDVNSDIDDFQLQEINYSKMQISMEKLGEPCFSILSDYYIQQLNMTQISEKHGYTNADNAKTQKYKCLQRLKKYFLEQ